MVSDEKIKKYFAITSEALSKVREQKEFSKEGKDLLDLAERYFKDAKFFLSKGKKDEAFAAVCYAHAFLDAGALLGLFKVKDSRLFMVG